MADKSWFKITAVKGQNPEVHIFDVIGMWGVSAADFSEALRSLGTTVPEIDLRINSPGGDTTVGSAIYTMLQRQQARGTKVNVYIEGLAASMASYLAMVGDTITIADNALMMIHNPGAVEIGEAKDMRRTADLLDKVRANMVSVYARRSGQTPETVEAIMDAETWYTAEEAVAMGFADSIEEVAEMAATFNLAQLSTKLGFTHPPTASADGYNRGDAATEEAPDMETAEQMEARLRAELTPAITAQVEAKAVADAAAKAKAETDAAAAAAAKDTAPLDPVEVVALCKLAGFADAAGDYIVAKKTKAQVITDLEAKKTAAALAATKTRSATGAAALSNHTASPAAGKDDEVVAQVLDHDKVWAKYNARKAQ